MLSHYYYLCNPVSHNLHVYTTRLFYRLCCSEKCNRWIMLTVNVLFGVDGAQHVPNRCHRSVVRVVFNGAAILCLWLGLANKSPSNRLVKYHGFFSMLINTSCLVLIRSFSCIKQIMTFFLILNKCCLCSYPIL